MEPPLSSGNGQVLWDVAVLLVVLSQTAIAIVPMSQVCNYSMCFLGWSHKSIIFYVPLILALGK
jgi:hypothetical protein